LEIPIAESGNIGEACFPLQYEYPHAQNSLSSRSGMSGVESRVILGVGGGLNDIGGSGTCGLYAFLGGCCGFLWAVCGADTSGFGSNFAEVLAA
jgi:hypothetical protein